MTQKDSPKAPVDAWIGRTVDNRYRITRPIAVGGMGSVFQAEQLNLRRQVAIKVFAGSEPVKLERFRREAEALAAVSHPSIVEVYDFIVEFERDVGVAYLVMPFVAGMDLEDYLHIQPDRRLRVDAVAQLLIPVASALVELHANGIIHRDIKPANIIRFMRADGHPGVKLVDFGVARRNQDPGITRTGAILGTPPYIPPEVLRREPHTPLSDIFSFGATLFELLTGEPPFGRDTLQAIVARTLESDPVLPEALEGTAMGVLITLMLDKNPRRRPDAHTVLGALEHVRREVGAGSPGPGPKETLAGSPWGSR